MVMVLAAFLVGFYLGVILMGLLAAAGKDRECVCHPGIAEDWNSPEDAALWDDR